MKSTDTISSPSSKDLRDREFNEPATLVDFMASFKAIKKDFRQKRYLRAYHFLQQHRPASEEHLILYYQASLQCIARLVRAGALRKETRFEQLDYYCEKAIILIKRLTEELSCEKSFLVGRKAVKFGTDRRIDRMWSCILDLVHDIALGYRLAGRNKDAIRCLRGGQKLADELTNSLTRNTTVLGKIVRLKMQLGVLSLEMGLPVKAIAYLEQALEISRTQLAIREFEECDRRNSTKGSAERVNQTEDVIERKRMKSNVACRKHIIILFVQLALAYESLGTFDVVAFLITQTKALVDDFKIDKADGTAKALDKLESQEFLWRFEKHSMALEQLDTFCCMLFSHEQLLKIGQERQERSNEDHQIKPVNPESLLSQIDRLAERNRKSLKSLKVVVVTKPSAEQLESVKANEERTFRISGTELPQSPSEAMSTTPNVMELRQGFRYIKKQKHGDDPAKASVSIAHRAGHRSEKGAADAVSRLISELLTEVVAPQGRRNIGMKKIKKQSNQNTAPRNTLLKNRTQSSAQITSLGLQSRIDASVGHQLKQSQAYIKAYMDVVDSKKRFKPFCEVQTQLRSLSTQMRKVEHEIDYEKARIKSRSRPRPSCSQTPRMSVRPDRTGGISLMKTNCPQGLDSATAQLIVLAAQSVMKGSFQRTSTTNIEFQQLILRHKDLFKLNKLEIHCFKNRESKPERLRRNGRKVSYHRNTQLIAKLNAQSQGRIQQLLQELRAQQPTEEGKQNQQPKEDGLVAFRKTSKLLLSYNNSAQARKHRGSRMRDS